MEGRGRKSGDIMSGMAECEGLDAAMEICYGDMLGELDGAEDAVDVV